MCFGLLIRLLKPIFPRHHRHGWPQSRGNPDATQKSQINSSRIKRRLVPRYVWDFFCSQGVWRSYMKTLPPPPALLTTFWGRVLVFFARRGGAFVSAGEEAHPRRCGNLCNAQRCCQPRLV